MTAHHSRFHPRIAFAAALLLTPPALLAHLVLAGPSTQSQSGPPSAAAEFSADLPGSTLWRDTGLDLHPGDSVRVIADGELRYAGAPQPTGPDGFPRGFKDFLRFLPIAVAGRGALIARIGGGPAAVPFFVGASSQFTARADGRLFLGINQMLGDTGEGAYHVSVRILSHSAGAPAQPSVSENDAAAFSALFCSVFEREHPDAGKWGPCSDYYEDPSSERVALPAIPRNYRFAIVTGVLSACGGNSTAFLEGREHLRTVHGITVDLIPAPNGSSAANGKTIAQFLKANYRPGGPKFILLGYSKGAVDILEGVSADPQAARAVAALITVAGAIGGSPLADFLPVQAQKWIQAISLGECKGDLYSAFRSLRRDVRRKFLAQHPDPGFPVYSIAAVSDRAHTSKILLEGWELLSIFGQPEDSQLLEPDTRFPGGTNLGAVLADHMAVAIPLNPAGDPTIIRLVNHNHFPRTALLESLFRYVTADLAAH